MTHGRGARVRRRGWWPRQRGCRGCCGCCSGCLLVALGLAVVLALYTIIPNAYPAYPSAARAGGAEPAPPVRAAGLPWLHSTGRVIADQAGRQVLLRGMNVIGLLHARDTGSGRLPGPSGFAQMARDGFDVIRLPITWAQIEPRPGRFSTAYLGRIRQVVADAAAHGIYTVIDLHNIDWSQAYGGDGAPAWAIAGPLPHRVPLAPPWDHHVAPGVLASYGIFWMDWGGWQADVTAAWRFVAQAFTDDPAVAGYDLWNEPHPFPIPPGLYESKFLLPFEARLITALARVAPRQMWITEQTLDFGLPTYVGRLPYPNQVYSSHVFATLLEPPWQTPVPEYATPLRILDAQAGTAGAAAWVGEIGGPPTPGSDRWMAREMNQLDHFRLGFAYWAWSGAGSWSFVDQPQRLRLVARGYPRATPGRLTSLRFDVATGQLRVSFTGRTRGRALLVAVPGFDTRYRLRTSDPAGAVVAHLDRATHVLSVVIRDRRTHHTVTVDLES
ncbi:MAG TPA: cellulase family glycosylhydrolase [Verrucomicrobiae bacterium]|nr:cellulase family glycosylhydrolase [Verrucomicrobiae bacterium]